MKMSPHLPSSQDPDIRACHVLCVSIAWRLWWRDAGADAEDAMVKHIEDVHLSAPPLPQGPALCWVHSIIVSTYSQYLLFSYLILCHFFLSNNRT